MISDRQFHVWYIVLAAVALVVLQQLFGQVQQVETISYSHFGPGEDLCREGHEGHVCRCRRGPGVASGMKRLYSLDLLTCRLRPPLPGFHDVVHGQSLIAACAAASRAIGTRNGEQLT